MFPTSNAILKEDGIMRKKIQAERDDDTVIYGDFYHDLRALRGFYSRYRKWYLCLTGFFVRSTVEMEVNWPMGTEIGRFPFRYSMMTTVGNESIKEESPISCIE
jgi:hypothetical protein